MEKIKNEHESDDYDDEEDIVNKPWINKVLKKQKLPTLQKEKT
jgi:hypothetical protein